MRRKNTDSHQEPAAQVSRHVLPRPERAPAMHSKNIAMDLATADACLYKELELWQAKAEIRAVYDPGDGLGQEVAFAFERSEPTRGSVEYRAWTGWANDHQFAPVWCERVRLSQLKPINGQARTEVEWDGKILDYLAAFVDGRPMADSVAWLAAGLPDAVAPGTGENAMNQRTQIFDKPYEHIRNWICHELRPYWGPGARIIGDYRLEMPAVEDKRIWVDATLRDSHHLFEGALRFELVPLGNQTKIVATCADHALTEHHGKPMPRHPIDAFFDELWDRAKVEFNGTVDVASRPAISGKHQQRAKLPQLPPHLLRKRRETVRRLKLTGNYSYREIALKAKCELDEVRNDLSWLRRKGYMPKQT
jgi:hypothetical protein